MGFVGYSVGGDYRVMRYEGKYLDIEGYLLRCSRKFVQLVPVSVEGSYIRNHEKDRYYVGLSIILMNVCIDFSYTFGGKNYYEHD